jgi:hypothetical protein
MAMSLYHCGNAAIAARLFLRMRGILKIFSENMILFEDIFREIVAFFY